MAVLVVELLLRGALVPHVHARAAACEHTARPHIHLHQVQHSHHHPHHDHAHHHGTKRTVESSASCAQHDKDAIYVNHDGLLVLTSRFQLPDQLQWPWSASTTEKHVADYLIFQVTARPAWPYPSRATPRLLCPHLMRI